MNNLAQTGLGKLKVEIFNLIGRSNFWKIKKYFTYGSIFPRARFIP